MEIVTITFRFVRFIVIEATFPFLLDKSIDYSKCLFKENFFLVGVKTFPFEIRLNK